MGEQRPAGRCGTGRWPAPAGLASGRGHRWRASCSRICSARDLAVYPRNTTGGDDIRRRAYSKPDTPRHAPIRGTGRGALPGGRAARAEGWN